MRDAVSSLEYWAITAAHSDLKMTCYGEICCGVFNEGFSVRVCEFLTSIAALAQEARMTATDTIHVVTNSIVGAVTHLGTFVAIETR